MANFEEVADETGADHFDPLEFDGAIETNGTPAEWRRATRCPCVDSSTGAYQLDCPYHAVGLGVVWGDPEEIKVLMPGRTDRFTAEMAGGVEMGGSMMVVKSTMTPSHADRIDLMAAEFTTSGEIFTVGDVNKLGHSKERLRFNPIELEYATAIVAGQLVTYVFPQVVVGDDGVITWDGGPPQGTQYSVRYRGRPAYVCWSPQSRDENAQKMPYRVAVKRLDSFEQRVVI